MELDQDDALGTYSTCTEALHVGYERSSQPSR